MTRPRVFRPRAVRPGGEAGLSLIELLVVLVLGSLILLGLIRLFSDTKQGYRTQDSQARLQENARFGLDYLSHALRLADFWGSAGAAGYDQPRGSRVTLDGAGTALAAYTGLPGACTAAWLADPANGLVGYEGTSTTVPAALNGCLGSVNNYVPKSDAVVVRYADPDIYATTAELVAGTRSDLYTNGRVWVRSQAGGRGTVFDASKAAAVAAARATVASPRSPVAPYADQQDGVFNYKFQPQLFYVRTCGELTTGTCSAASDYGLPKPNLCVLHPQGGGTGTDTLATDCLVENVEMMKIAYGLDTNNDNVVDRYAMAGSVTAAQWPQVVTARVMLVVRGDREDAAFPDTFSYSLLGLSYTPGDTERFVAADRVRRYGRRVFVREVQLRNRVRR